jgi:hypothetical protein
MAESTTLTGRLRRCIAAGQLTHSDLGYWFDINRTVIRSWIIDAREPRTRLVELDRRLKLLETALEDGAFPVPHSISEHQRPTYIREQYHAANDRGVSASATG